MENIIINKEIPVEEKEFLKAMVDFHCGKASFNDLMDSASKISTERLKEIEEKIFESAIPSIEEEKINYLKGFKRISSEMKGEDFVEEMKKMVSIGFNKFKDDETMMRVLNGLVESYRLRNIDLLPN